VIPEASGSAMGSLEVKHFVRLDLVVELTEGLRIVGQLESVGDLEPIQVLVLQRTSY
jgi:hypothetical protein